MLRNVATENSPRVRYVTSTYLTAKLTLYAQVAQRYIIFHAHAQSALMGHGIETCTRKPHYAVFLCTRYTMRFPFCTRCAYDALARIYAWILMLRNLRCMRCKRKLRIPPIRKIIVTLRYSVRYGYECEHTRQRLGHNSTQCSASTYWLRGT